MKSYLKIVDIAATLQVKDITVRRWIASGQLEAYKFGKEYRIEETDFDLFLQSRKVKKKESKKV